ncbi:MAG: hypothetical protein NC816_00715 [Candidatus Omnitrophica bacterium]|nr:hypothetical protein [Candidatus Omnitrophota bacterium]
MKNKKYLVTYDERRSLSRLRKLKNKLKKYTPDEILEKFKDDVFILTQKKFKNYVKKYGKNFHILREVKK